MFYEVQWTFKSPLWKGAERMPKEYPLQLAKLGEQSVAKGETVFVASVTARRMTLIVAASSTEDCQRVSSRFRERLGVCVRNETCCELTLQVLNAWLNTATRKELIEEGVSAKIREKYDLTRLCERSSDILFEERVMNGTAPVSERILEARERWFSASMAEELERIRQGFRGASPVGHPVHYIVRVERDGAAMCDSLLNALYQAGRLKSARVSRYVCNDQHEFSVELFECFYKQAEGGTVEIVMDDDLPRWMHKELVDGVCQTVMRYAAKVLTVFRFAKNSRRIEAEILKRLGKFPLYAIHSGEACGDAAQRYLCRRAKERKMRPDKALLAFADVMQTTDRLDEQFEGWYAQKLRRKVYPQYCGLPVVSSVREGDETKSDAAEELSELIGLAEVKKTAMRIVRYFKAQRRLTEHGVGGGRPSMHMVFTGNPGTAKTTVARVLAKLFEQEGLLNTGRFKEVGRADLIGQYVGQTAPLVRKAFDQARGGLLFIDEAYSLVDGKAGMYGDEAINTIVQEMENRREDTIVIFAGYPEPMKCFLDRNAGLRSRIAFHIDFPDYSAEELCEIAAAIARKDGLQLSTGACERLVPLFENARLQADFGNGRYARKVIEQARMAQAERLMMLDETELEESGFTTLCAEDIHPVVADKTLAARKQPIGFCG